MANDSKLIKIKKKIEDQRAEMLEMLKVAHRMIDMILTMEYLYDDPQEQKHVSDTNDRISALIRKVEGGKYV